MRAVRLLTRIVRLDANINPCTFNKSVTLRLAPTLHGVSRCLCSNVKLKDEIYPSEEVSSQFPEKRTLVEKKISKAVRPPFDIQYLADSYPVLQNLVDLGVEIFKFNRDKSLCEFITRLDFDTDIKPYLIFLQKHGVPKDKLGEFLTRNPYILRCHLEDLDVRINYLESKKFTDEMISSIITANPKWLGFRVELVDSVLGEVQQSFQFSGDQMRRLVVSFPGIVCVHPDVLKLNMFTFKEEFGITLKECQTFILKYPRLLRIDNSHLVHVFHYLIYDMEIPVHLILEEPSVLKCKFHSLKTRHQFLKRLGRAQYNPKLPGFVSLTDLVKANDHTFSRNTAKSSVETYYDFQKTL